MSESEFPHDVEDPAHPFHNKHLFALGTAIDEIRDADGAVQTAGATAKFVGKTALNTGVIAAKSGWLILKGMGAAAKKASEAAGK
jgi:hypothetical protein